MCIGWVIVLRSLVSTSSVPTSTLMSLFLHTRDVCWNQFHSDYFCAPNTVDLKLNYVISHKKQASYSKTMGNDAQPLKRTSCCRLRPGEVCCSWGSPFLQTQGLKSCMSVMLGRCRSEDKSSKETWNREIRTTLHSKGWQRLENGFCCCVSCVQGHISASVFSVTTLCLHLASQHLACQVTQDCGMRQGIVWLGCEPGDQHEAKHNTKEPHRWPVAWTRYLPGLVQPAAPVTALQKWGWRHHSKVLYLANTLERICTAQCIPSFCSREKICSHKSEVNSKMWRGNYSHWLSLFLLPFQMFFICICVQHVSRPFMVFIKHGQPPNFLVF